MPIFRATARASSISRKEQQPLDFSSRHSPLVQVLIVTPIGSKPFCFKRAAETELSTPPDMATMTRLFSAREIIRGGLKSYSVTLFVFFGALGIAGGFLDGFLEFPNAFPKAFADLGQAAGPEKKQTDKQNNQKFRKTDSKHRNIAYSLFRRLSTHAVETVVSEVLKAFFAAGLSDHA